MNVEETAASIKDMTIRGAGKIARAGAAALSDFAGNYKGNDRASFLTDLEKAKGIAPWVSFSVEILVPLILVDTVDDEELQCPEQDEEIQHEGQDDTEFEGLTVVRHLDES